MADEDWYRRETWTETDREAFFAKLTRARKKTQYLRIQALTIQERHPDAALELLEEYFELAGNSDIDLAQAHTQRAECLLLLGRTDEAVESFRSCFAREDEFPGMRTRGFLSFGLFVARERRRDLYDELIDVYMRREKWPFFPRDHYEYNAVLALVLDDSGEKEAALSCARIAQDAVTIKDTGLRRHPDLGLVTTEPFDIRERLAAILH